MANRLLAGTALCLLMATPLSAEADSFAPNTARAPADVQPLMLVQAEPEAPADADECPPGTSLQDGECLPVEEEEEDPAVDEPEAEDAPAPDEEAAPDEEPAAEPSADDAAPTEPQAEDEPAPDVGAPPEEQPATEPAPDDAEPLADDEPTPDEEAPEDEIDAEPLADDEPTPDEEAPEEETDAEPLADDEPTPDEEAPEEETNAEPLADDEPATEEEEAIPQEEPTTEPSEPSEALPPEASGEEEATEDDGCPPGTVEEADSGCVIIDQDVPIEEMEEDQELVPEEEFIPEEEEEDLPEEAEPEPDQQVPDEAPAEEDVAPEEPEPGEVAPTEEEPAPDADVEAPAEETDEQPDMPDEEEAPAPPSDEEAQEDVVDPEEFREEIRSMIEEEGERVELGQTPEDQLVRRRALREPREDARVVREFTDNRTIVEINNNIFIESPDDDRIVRADDRIYYERLRGGRVREVVERADGSRLITLRNRYGDVLRRVRVAPDGREYVLVYVPERRFDDVRRFEDPARELPPFRLTIPMREYVLEAREADDPERYYTFLRQPPVERVRRLYSLEEVRYSARVREMMRRVDVNTVEFEFGSARIEEGEIAVLEAMAEAILRMLEENPAESFLIEGHTDAVGSDLANLALSDRRAEAVARALTDVFDVPPENLVTQGYGEQFLLIDTQEPERRNRRVALRRITPLVAPVAAYR